MSENLDPNLRKAMKEIKKIINKYDVGGLVILASQSHGEYKLFIEPSWSVVNFEGTDNDRIRFRSAREIDNEASETAHMLFSTRDLCGKMFLTLDSVYKQLSEHCEIDHKLGEITPSDI